MASSSALLEVDGPRRQQAHKDAESSLLIAMTCLLRRDLVDLLRPRPEDFAQVFQGDAIDIAMAYYTRMWTDDPVVSPPMAQRRVAVAAATASDFRTASPAARPFPRGYQRIAHDLASDVIWLAWKFVTPGGKSGLSQDGLALVGGRWIWLPKPYRALACNAAVLASQWAE